MKQTAVNEFKDGLNLDLHPLVTPNTVLTDNLNGTFITYNGNEFCLQNDRGNTEVAHLSDGFIPIGAKEHNGIIYIVSVKDDITEIGTYPGVNWDIKSGELINEYVPLKNLYDENDRLDAFQIENLYSLETPVTIDVQDSYDGSVNLIIIADEIKPIIINSAFSVQANNKYELLERDQTANTNKYRTKNLLEQLSLIRTSNLSSEDNDLKLTSIDLGNVSKGGQLKGGNYIFYIKFGDDDYNKTDIVAESGIVSVFNGNDGVPSTISGTLLDERTDKTVELIINGLNHVYSKVYVYYTREYSDVLGYRMTESGMIVEPYTLLKTQIEEIGRDPSTNKPIYREVDATYQSILITGFEQTVPIDVEELNIDYHTIDWAKAETQHSNMLFLGNVGQSETFKLYKHLKDFTLGVTSSIKLGQMKETGGDSFSNKNYYSTKNIYYSLGYWPEEWYRFGIVYVLKDGSTTPVFNMQGGIFENTSYLNITNDYGVFKTPRVNVLQQETPLYFEFKLPDTSVLSEYNDKIKAWFVVRQKRIPTTICQGIGVKIDKRSYLPLISDGSKWIIQSFLSLNRKHNKVAGEGAVELIGDKNDPESLRIIDDDAKVPAHILRPFLEILNDFKPQHEGPTDANHLKSNYTYRFIDLTKPNYHHGSGIISLDPCVNSSVGSMLDGSEFEVKKEYTVNVNFNKEAASLIFNNNLSNFLNERSTSYKLAFIRPETLVKSIDNYNFSNLAGVASDAGSFKYVSSAFGVYIRNSDKYYAIQASKEIGDDVYGTKDYYGYNSTHNVNLVRGKFVPYIGVAGDLSNPGLFSIRLKDIQDEYAELVRSQDSSEYYTVTNRLSLDTIASVYRGDCYICRVGMRILSNFIDPVAPATDVIVEPLSWEFYVRQMSRWGGDQSGVDGKRAVVDYSKVNLSDVNNVDLGYWVTFPCLSSYNLGLRAIDHSHTDEIALLGSPRSFYPLNGASTTSGNKMQESFLLNDGLSATVGRKRYNLMPDVPYSKSEFTNRIMFSNVNVTDSFQNGYRVFQGLSYKDYDKQYGEITKLIAWGSNILCVMEHGIGLVPVNEKALMQTTTGEAIHIYGHGVLPDQMTIVSQDYGSKYPHSVIRTPIGVYGIDTDARKIWRVTDKQGFETISDMKIESYLNDNLFTNINSSIQTVDVRTHYNAFKGDVMFTFYNTNKEYINVQDSLIISLNDYEYLRVLTNASNVSYEFDDPTIAEIQENGYIKGLNIGQTILHVRGEFIEKSVRIIVIDSSVNPDVPNASFDGLPSTITLYINDSYTYLLSDVISAELNYNSDVFSANLSENKLIITGLLEGTDVLTINNNGQITNCTVIVLDKNKPIDPDDTEPEGGEIPINPDESEPSVDGDVYYSAWVHRPRLNVWLGIPYPDDIDITVTYDGTSSVYTFESGQELKSFNFKKNSTVIITVDVPGYDSDTFTYNITKDKMNLYPVITEYKTITVNIINPINATVLVNNEYVSNGESVSFKYGTVVTIEADANGYLEMSETFTLTEDETIDINLDPGDFYLSFSISYYIYSEEGGYQTCGGAPVGTRVDYEITNSNGSYTGSRDTSIGLSIPLSVGDSVSYTISCDGYNPISGSVSNIQSEQRSRYFMTPADYYEFRAHNIPDGYRFVLVNGGICWDTNVLNFKTGAELTIEIPTRGTYTYIMPNHDVIINVTELVS